MSRYRLNTVKFLRCRSSSITWKFFAGGQSYGGSANVGSRLAGDSVGSRLAGAEPQSFGSASHFTGNPQFYSKTSSNVSNSGLTFVANWM